LAALRESLVIVEPPVVPIETLAPAPAPFELPVPPEPEPLPPSPPPLVLTESTEVSGDTPDLVGSWVAYERKVAGGIGPGSLEELMGEVAETTAPARDTVRPSAPPPEAQAPVAAAEYPPVVDVKTLLYRGNGALARAQELRELAKRTPPAELPALFEEVCDLVVLALEPAPAS